jgi:nitrogen fixation/metabolism regulation signal transduction histidine kinase
VHLAKLPDGNVLAILDEISDVVLTEHIQSGARAYLEDVLNHLDRGVLVVDAALKTTFMNVAQRYLLERLGTTTPWVDAVGLHVAEAYPIINRDEWLALCVEVVACGTIGDRSRVRASAGAAPLWLDIRVLPLEGRADGGGGAVIITEDVTCMVALEAAAVARERHAWVAQIALSLNHEINNPLTTILGAAETLRLDGGLDARALARIEAVRSSALRIADVLRRLDALAAPRTSAIVDDATGVHPPDPPSSV